MPKTIVFIHGNFVTRHCWDAWVARYSSRGHSCVSIPYPGRDRPVDAPRRNPDNELLGRLTIEQVIEHHVRAIRALPEKPIIIGHSFGGLLTQIMVQRDLAAAAVAIDSVPPPGVLTTKLSFFRSLWPVLNPLIPSSRPYLMPFSHFQYSFSNAMPLAEQQAAWERDVVPESRRLGRGGLTSAARIDFRKAHAPLLLIAGEKDHIMPAALNRRNHSRYGKSGSVTEFKEFTGRDHYAVIGGKGWEEVADYALDWSLRMVGSSGARTSPSSTVAHG